MNELTKHLVDGILNEDKQEVVALYAGGFKPPTAGHFQVVEEALKQYPEIDKLIVLVGGGVRDGIEQAESILVWEIYQNYLPMKVEIQPATKPPIGAVYSYAKNNPDDTIYWILGARDGKDEDLSDIVQRTAAIDKAEDKYNNVEVKVITTSNAGMSGTNARKALLAGNREAFTQFIPAQVEEKDEIFNILRPAVKETEDPDDGKAAPFGSGYGKVNENASYSKDIDIQGKIDQLTQHMIDKGYNIEPLPGLEFVDGDTENARDFFGKTAYYDPINKVIVLYTEGRHPKDIVRSYAHEMIHHIQNLEGRLGNITTTNTQEDDHLNDIEAEANLKGTMTFRNWTDSLQEGKGGADTSWTGADNETITLQDILELTKDIKIVNLPTEKLAPIVLNWDDNPEEIERISQVKISTQYPILVMVDEQNKIQWILDGNHRAQKALRAKAKTIPAKLIKPSNLNSKARKILLGIIDEANLKGTMTFRNWTDSLNEIGDASAAKLEWNPAQIEKIAKEIERKAANQEEDTVEYYDMLPAIEVISPESRTRYRVTVDASVDKPTGWSESPIPPPPSITLRVDFTTEEGGDNVINKGEQYKILATLTDIIIQLINRVNEIDSTTLDLVKFYAKDDTEGKYANSDSKRGKLYQAFINKNLSKLPGDWKMSTSNEVIMLSPVVSEGFDKKLGKDPFGLNAYAYELAKGLEESILSEGRYDKLTNQLSSIAFETIKDGYESGRKILDTILTVGPEDEEPDIESNDFEFDFRIVADYTEDVYKVDGGANAGFDKKGDSITPLLIVNFGIPKKPKWSTISMDLKDVVRHELEHLTQDGDNVKGVVNDPKKPELNRPGKQMADDEKIRDMIDADLLPKADYFKLEKEIDAMMQGLYFKAKKSKRPFKDVIDDYLDTQPISKEDKELILNLWRSRRKALSLPVFENEEKVMDYKIYLDMDGVLVDFDQQFKDLTGMMPREFEAKHGSTGFWEAIDKAGVGFWRGMSWMPGGEALYNRASQFNHELLSSPSRSELSKIGKRLWRRDKTPSTKLTLSRSYLKKNYAAPNHILIDDREDNIQQWRDAGGIGILYKSAEQVNAELDKLGL